MSVSMIVAIDKKGAIGKKGKLLIKIKEDLIYFKKVTINKCVIMGRLTYEEIGNPLPRRNNIVISSKKIKGVQTCKTLKEALSFHADNFIIGGEKIFKDGLKYATILYITEFDRDFRGDKYFPMFSKSDYTLLSSLKYYDPDNNLDYYRKVYSLTDRRTADEQLIRINK